MFEQFEGKVTVMSNTLTHLILRCEACGDIKELCTDEEIGGHSWQAATAIADEFDRHHDEECGE